MLTNNETIKELIDLQTEYKKIEKRISEIKEACRAKGSFSTADYVVAVKEIKRECVGPTSMVLQQFGREKLDALGLIYETTYLVVSAQPKGRPYTGVLT